MMDALIILAIRLVTGLITAGGGSRLGLGFLGALVGGLIILSDILAAARLAWVFGFTVPAGIISFMALCVVVDKVAWVQSRDQAKKIFFGAAVGDVCASAVGSCYDRRRTSSAGGRSAASLWRPSGGQLSRRDPAPVEWKASLLLTVGISHETKWIAPCKSGKYLTVQGGCVSFSRSVPYLKEVLSLEAVNDRAKSSLSIYL